MSLTASDSTFDFKSYAASRRQRIEERLVLYLNPGSESGDVSRGEPEQLWEAMRYSVLSGGKRLRALLCLAAGEAVSPENMPESEIEDKVLPTAGAIEMVHAMSLIHDDLPCLDNDDMRRGKPTNHKVFGEAMALLAGDALLILANQILIERTPLSISRSVVLDVSLELSKALGPAGMVGGQVDDMRFTGAASNLLSGGAISSQAAILLKRMHEKKTGALIRFALWSGAKLAGASTKQLDELSQLGDIMGLAFQITDDLLDVTGDAKTIGKTPGKDEASDKTTWVRLFGADGARQKLRELQDQGMSAITQCGLSDKRSQALSALLDYAIHRVN